MPELENRLEDASARTFDPDNTPGVPEGNKEQLSPLEKKITVLNDLEGIIGTMPIKLKYKGAVSEHQDEKGNWVDDPIKPLSVQMKELIQKGHDHQLTGMDKKDRIRHAIKLGNIREQDLTDRINNIFADIVNFEEQMKLDNSEDNVANLIQAIEEKYKGQDWPD